MMKYTVQETLHATKHGKVSYCSTKDAVRLRFSNICLQYPYEDFCLLHDVVSTIAEEAALKVNEKNIGKRRFVIGFEDGNISFRFSYRELLELQELIDYAVANVGFRDLVLDALDSSNC